MIQFFLAFIFFVLGRGVQGFLGFCGCSFGSGYQFEEREGLSKRWWLGFRVGFWISRFDSLLDSFSFFLRKFTEVMLGCRRFSFQDNGSSFRSVEEVGCLVFWLKFCDSRFLKGLNEQGEVGVLVFFYVLIGVIWFLLGLQFVFFVGFV